MAENWTTFLASGGRGSNPVSVAVAVFGKHRGWADHFELGVSTGTLTRFRDYFYINLLQRIIHSGEWESIEASQRVSESKRWLVWQRGEETLMTLMWDSSDSKGRTQYPALLSVHFVGVDLHTIVSKFVPVIDRSATLIQNTESSEEVESIRESLRAECEQALEAYQSNEDRYWENIREFAAHREVAHREPEFVRILYLLQTRMRAFSLGAKKRASKSELTESIAHLRLPVLGPPGIVALADWVAFLRTQIDHEVPIFACAPESLRWIDIDFGRPTEQTLSRIGRNAEGFPLSSDIPYEITPEFDESCRVVCEALATIESSNALANTIFGPVLPEDIAFHYPGLTTSSRRRIPSMGGVTAVKERFAGSEPASSDSKGRGDSKLEAIGTNKSLLIVSGIVGVAIIGMLAILSMGPKDNNGTPESEPEESIPVIAAESPVDPLAAWADYVQAYDDWLKPTLEIYESSGSTSGAIPESVDSLLRNANLEALEPLAAYGSSDTLFLSEPDEMTLRSRARELGRLYEFKGKLETATSGFEAQMVEELARIRDAGLTALAGTFEERLEPAPRDQGYFRQLIRLNALRLEMANCVSLLNRWEMGLAEIETKGLRSVEGLIESEQAQFASWDRSGDLEASVDLLERLLAILDGDYSEQIISNWNELAPEDDMTLVQVVESLPDYAPIPPANNRMSPLLADIAIQQEASRQALASDELDDQQVGVISELLDSMDSLVSRSKEMKAIKLHANAWNQLVTTLQEDWRDMQNGDAFALLQESQDREKKLNDMKKREYSSSRLQEAWTAQLDTFLEIEASAKDLEWNDVTKFESRFDSLQKAVEAIRSIAFVEPEGASVSPEVADVARGAAGDLREDKLDLVLGMIDGSEDVNPVEKGQELSEALGVEFQEIQQFLTRYSSANSALNSVSWDTIAEIQMPVEAPSVLSSSATLKSELDALNRKLDVAKSLPSTSEFSELYKAFEVELPREMEAVVASKILESDWRPEGEDGLRRLVEVERKIGDGNESWIRDRWFDWEAGNLSANEYRAGVNTARRRLGIDFGEETPRIDFNEAVARFNSSAKTEKALRSAIKGVIATFNNLSEDQKQPYIASVQALIDLSETETAPPKSRIDFSKVGPGLAGLKGTASEDDHRVTYKHSVGEMTFVDIADVGSQALFVATTEVSTGEFLRIGNLSGLGSFRGFIQSAKTNYDANATGRQHAILAARFTQKEGEGAKLNAVNHWGESLSAAAREVFDSLPKGKNETSESYPVRFVSPSLASEFADSLKCRLLTPEEWKRLVTKANPVKANLRDEETESLLRKLPGYRRNNESSTFKIFVPKGLKEHAISLRASDGHLLFAPTQSGSGQSFSHVLGNVAEFLQDAGRNFYIAGGSAMSSYPPNAEPQPWPRQDKGGYADVGFRIAFEAKRAPEPDLPSFEERYSSISNDIRLTRISR